MNLPSTHPPRYDCCDKTDALEAYNAFRSAGAGFGWIILLSLIMVHAGFWIVDRGLLDSQVPTPLYVDYALTGDGSEPQPDQTAKALSHLVDAGLTLFNYLLYFGVTLYCLTMLMGMHLALVGRLGSLAESGKAFFISLILFLLILPWQKFVTGESMGTLFSYQELIRQYSERHGPFFSSLDVVLYYFRYVGVWVLAVALMMMSRWRSRQAARKVIARITGEQLLTAPISPEGPQSFSPPADDQRPS